MVKHTQSIGFRLRALWARASSLAGALAGTRTETLLQALTLVVLVWAVYGNGLQGPFTFDDWHVIPQNPAVRGPADIPSFFVDTTAFSILTGNRDYRPLFLSSMALCWWAGGGETLPFHLVCVTIHMGNVLLLFFVLRLLFSRWLDPVGGLSERGRRWGAFVGAALFAVHPLASESVNYISSQSVPMAALFYLAAFLLFLLAWGRKGAVSGPARWALVAVSCLAYGLALLSKPVAVTFPPMLLIWEVLFGRCGSWPSGEGRWGWARHPLRLAKHAPYWALTLAYLLVRKAIIASAFSLGDPGRSVFSHYLTQTKALVFYYARLALWPVGLNVDREYTVSQSIFEREVIVSVLVLVAAGLLLLRFRRHRNLVFWSLWFPLGLAVTAYLVILIQVVNEHRVYLSLAGLCAVAALLVARLWEALPVRVWDSSIGRRTGRAVLAVAVPALLLALAAGTLARNRVWSSELALWEDAALHRGTYRAHMNYALALEGAKRPEEALAQFREAVELGPWAWPHMNLGIAYIKRDSADKGLWHLRTAVRLWPTLPEARRWLAWGLERDGQLDEAEAELRKALELRPAYLDALEALAGLQGKLGRPEEALAAYRRLVETDPGQARDTGLLFRVAFAQQKHGSRKMAIDLYEELLRLAPRHRQGTFNLAYALMGGDGPADWSRAAELFEKVLEIDPDYAEALHRLATVHWKLGETAEAARWDRLYLEGGGGHRGLERESRRRLAALRGAEGTTP